MRMEEYAVGEYKGTTLLQIIAILIILGLLSVVAIPRYIDMKKDRQREAEDAEARGYIRALHNVLTANTENHRLRGTKWVENGKELMGLLEAGWVMPQGMQYADNVWTDTRTGLKWEFDRASDLLPPRIRRVEQRPSPETWEMEPIGRVPKVSPPRS